MAAMRGKVCVVTGANSGIGKATARGLAAVGATVVMVCRDRARGATAQQEIRAATGNEAVELYQADLASLADVRRLAAQLLADHPRIDVLINNAGVMLDRRQMSADGFELQLAVNHLAPLLLTRLLQPALMAAAPSRVINVSSRVHSMGRIDFDDLQCTRKYKMFAAYGQSKLACVMATYALAERWQPLGITVNCLHPGVIDTNLGGMPDFVKKLLPKADKGARTSLHLAMAPELADVTGGYFSNCKPAKSSARSHDRAVRERLWQQTERLVGLA